MATMSVPLLLNPIMIKDYPEVQGYQYVMGFIAGPIILWIGMSFGLKKYKEQLENESKSKK